MFKELKSDPFYLEYKNYSKCVLDYAILKNSEFNGLNTHKEAVLFAMNNIYKDNMNSNNMEAMLISYEDFFKLPDNYEEERYHLINRDYHRPYWFLFLNPPYQTDYTINDFIKINNLLFPNGKENLEIYNWNVDWSPYFNEGLEWWGAMCVSIYDKTLGRFVIIFASSTD